MLSTVEQWSREKLGNNLSCSSGSLRQWQMERLRQRLEYAETRTRFYAGKLNPGSSLEELPFTFPHQLAADPLSFLAVPQSRVARVTSLANSGTTSMRKRVFFSADDLERTRDFFSAGMKNIVAEGDKTVILLSNRTENSLGTLLTESLARIGVCSEVKGSVRSVYEAGEAAEGFDTLVGMPAELLYLCHSMHHLRPRSVLLAADIAPLPLVKTISERWGCEVFTHYGHSEFGYGCAVDCASHQGMHLRHPDLIFEVVDPETGRAVTAGEPGEITITTLTAEAMPLIRYRTGNLSRLITAPCLCGGVLPRLGDVEGRLSNDIVLPEGEKINIYRLDTILFSNPAVRSFEAEIYEWRKKKILRLLVEADEKIDIGELEEKLSLSITIEVRYGKYDPFRKRGKRRVSVSEGRRQ